MVPRVCEKGLVVCPASDTDGDPVKPLFQGADQDDEWKDEKVQLVGPGNPQVTRRSEEYKKTVEYFKSKSAEIRYESEYGVKFKYNGKIFDIVKMTFDSPNDTIEAFDFTCCMFAAGTENIYHGDNTFIDLSKRQLMINKITYPASTLKRAIKYCSRGYAICDGELKKIVESIRNMEVEPEVEETEEISSGDEMRMFRGID